VCSCRVTSTQSLRCCAAGNVWLAWPGLPSAGVLAPPSYSQINSIHNTMYDMCEGGLQRHLLRIRAGRTASVDHTFRVAGRATFRKLLLKKGKALCMICAAGDSYNLSACLRPLLRPTPS
jgi:hypothetical protein